ncbi:metalloendopeptidase [Multifurca ochricompacta]|uniref:CAAX prenyl protease n=1 Tax=Multifurca ochricompacta TaxID=376703 RepID=A0AAD4QMA6_9AGAM|nr:metalloendopeptidase [Multifurca ochricompacta]
MDFLHAQLAAIQHRLAFVQEDPIDWRTYVLVFSWGICFFESYLLLRQYPLYSKPAPPAVLADHFSPEVFNKSQKYGKHKAKFSIVSGLYKQFIDTLQLASGVYYPWVWTVSGQLLGRAGYGPEYLVCLKIGSICFLLTFISTLPTLPLGLYQTFVLEEQHGFNKTTLSLYFADMLKGWALGVFLGTPLLTAFLYIFEWAGDRFVPWVMMLLFVFRVPCLSHAYFLLRLIFQLSMIVLYPTIIQPLFNKLSPLPEGELRTRIEALASKLKFPLKHLYEIDGSKRSSHSNAYFFGLPWSKHIVIFDTLIKQSRPEEVEAVLAHELGHWYYLHPTKLLFVSQLHLFTILALFPAFLNAPPLLRSFGFPESVAARPPPIIAFLLYQMVLTPLEAIVGMALNAVSRRFEYQADRFACELPSILHAESAEEKEAMKDMGTRLGRALIGLHVENLSTVWVDWLYSAYHHSHPTLTERLKVLGEHGSEGLGKAE